MWTAGRCFPNSRSPPHAFGDRLPGGPRAALVAWCARLRTRPRWGTLRSRAPAAMEAPRADTCARPRARDWAGPAAHTPTCLLPEGPSPLTPRTSSSLPFASPAPPRGREGLEGASRGWARPAGPLRLPRTVPHPVCCWCRLVTERGSGHTHTRRRVSLRPPFPGRPYGRSPGGAALGAEVFGARGFSAPRGRLTSGVRRPPPRPRPHSPSSVPPGPAPCSSSRRGSWAPNGALCPPPARTRP